MSAVNITALNVLDNPAPFLNPLQFEIHYECLTDLEDDLEWNLIYVGSAESEEHDQVLDNVMVGPVKQGKFKFVLQADAPKPDLIPKADTVGVTVILLTCSYKEAEFLRVGYYTSIEYQDEALREEPPDQPLVNKLWRNIITSNPRVTRFQNRFDNPPSEDGDVEDQAVEEADDDLVVGDDDPNDMDEEGDEDDNGHGNRQDQAAEEDDC